MFRKIVIALVLVGIAIPVRALTPQDAEYIGFRAGAETCRSIALGARRMKDVFLHLRPSNYDFDFIAWIQTLPSNHPMNQAYRRGSDKGTAPCIKQLQVLFEKGW
jgi:hypothetical protein